MARYGSAGWTTGVPPVMTMPTAPQASAPAAEVSPAVPPPSVSPPPAVVPAPEIVAPPVAAVPIPIVPPASSVPVPNAGMTVPEASPQIAATPKPPVNKCEIPVMAFFDFQPWGEPYDPEEGFRRGTIFPALDLPWKMEGGKRI